MTDNELVKALRLNAACDDYDDCDKCPMPYNDNGKRACVYFDKVVLPVAADRIEQLARENAELKEAQRWVPVGERLPEDGEIILGWHKYGFVVLTINAFDGMDKITHWQPIPQPPRGE